MDFHHCLCQCVITQKILLLLLPRSPSFYHDVLSDLYSINILGLTERTKHFSQRWMCTKTKSLCISPEIPCSSQVSISPKSVFSFFWEPQTPCLFRLCLFSSLFLSASVLLLQEKLHFLSLLFLHQTSYRNSVTNALKSL